MGCVALHHVRRQDASPHHKRRSSSTRHQRQTPTRTNHRRRSTTHRQRRPTMARLPQHPPRNRRHHLHQHPRSASRHSPTPRPILVARSRSPHRRHNRAPPWNSQGIPRRTTTLARNLSASNQTPQPNHLEKSSRNLPIRTYISAVMGGEPAAASARRVETPTLATPRTHRAIRSLHRGCICVIMGDITLGGSCRHPWVGQPAREWRRRNHD